MDFNVQNIAANPHVSKSIRTRIFNLSAAIAKTNQLPIPATVEADILTAVII